MQVVETPDNPAPPGGIVVPVRTLDGLLLRAAWWNAAAPSPIAECPGTVVLCTGRGEFIEKYFEVIGELLVRGFAVVCFDWRGQGLSARELGNSRKGHVDDFSLYERDLAAILAQVVVPNCPRPYFALAHSMAGIILLQAARAETIPFERIVLSAPMIDLVGLRFPRAVRALAEALDIVGLGAAYVPGGGDRSVLMKAFEGNVLTSDERRFARMAGSVAAAPQLSLGDPTIGWIHAAFRAMAAFNNPDVPRRIVTPILIVAAGADTVVDTRATERLASRLKAGHIISIPHARHEILMEVDAMRELFWAAFDAFVPGTRAEVEALATAQSVRGVS